MFLADAPRDTDTAIFQPRDIVAQGPHDNRLPFPTLRVKYHGQVCDVVETVIPLGPFADVHLFTKRNKDGVDVGLNDPAYFQISPTSGHFAPTVVGEVLALTRHANVMITHWKCASDVTLKDARTFDLSDYVFDYVLKFMRDFGHPLVLGGYSQSGVTATAATALASSGKGQAPPPIGLIISGSPLDVEAEPSSLSSLTRTLGLRALEANFREVGPSRLGRGRLILPGEAQLQALLLAETGRLMMDQFIFGGQLMMTTPFKALEKLQARHARARELSHTADLPAELVLHIAEEGFIKASLPKGELMLNGQRVDPTQITVPILAIGGERDQIVPPGQVMAIQTLCPRADIETVLVRGANHFQLKSGGAWQGEILPAYVRLLHAADETLSTPQKAARAAKLRALIHTSAARPH
ncbi:MAG: hypothetical protein EBQ89_03700 [Alphaproteobacteria bacterium]|nr:hypothetical protein [Alphaproteobacteria bacterium]